MQTSSSISYKRHRSPPQIIAYAVWLFARFNLSLREVEEMLLQRGIEISYETIRCWTAKFCPQIARDLHRRQAHPGDVWHLDEVVVKIRGQKYWLWRAVDQNGLVLEEILQKRRSKVEAKRLFRSLITQFGRPKRIVTDKLHSYGAAKRVMQGFRTSGGLQRFVTIHSATRNHFSRPTHRRTAIQIRYHRFEAFDAWYTAAKAA